MNPAALGAYAPRFRLPGDAVADALDSFDAPGVDSVAVPDADEDALTMAWEAARRALDAADAAADTLDALFLASTTLPTQDESQVPRLATALGAPERVDAREFTGSTAAAGEALTAARERGGRALVVASDAPRGDPDSPEGHAAGAGAAAILLAPDGPGAVSAHGTAATPSPGTRFRPRGSDATRGLGVTGYDRDAYRAALDGALDGVSTDGLDAAALTMPDGKLPYRAAGAAGLGGETVAAAETVSTLGDTGAASALLGVASARQSGAETVLLAAYGSGATCHAVRLDLSGVPVAASLDGDVELDYAAAMRRRGAFSTGPPEGGGAHVPVPTYRRSLPARYRLRAGRCRACGELSFPAENACPSCRAREGYDDVELPDAGTVTATTVIGTGGAPPEFVPQQERSGAYGTAIVEFEGPAGGTASVPLQVVLADADDAPAVGDRVRTVFRALYDQHGVRRYAAKAVPASR